MVKSTRNAHERVRELLELRRWNSVVEATDEILAAVPNDWWMWAARASALLQLGQSDDALSAAQRATGLSPDAEWPLRLQSMSLRSLGRRRAAIASARRATAVDPTSDAALVELSVAQNLGGRRRTAAATAKAAVGRNPDLLDGWLAPGAATTGRRPATAKAAYRRALAIDPNSSAATAALAALSGRGRRRDELNTAAARLDADAHEPRAALLAVDNILSGAAAVFAAAMVAAMVPGRGASSPSSSP